MTRSLKLSFHQINAQFNCDDENLVEHIRRDFSFFKGNAGPAHITINAHHQPPPYGILPPMRSRYISPRNVCYYHQGLKYIDYSGEALGIYNRGESTCDIYSRHDGLLHETCYMALLSLVSEQLDARHIHRVHALALAVNNKAILILLDMGGGKSTLAMGLLSSDNKFKLISEDSPLLDSKGNILPFPLRIGLHPKNVPSGIPKTNQRYFQTQEFDPKILIDIEHFEHNLQRSSSEPFLVLIGRRVLGRRAEIKPSSSYAALKEFVKNSVIGVGLFQGIEYVFQKGPNEIVKKIPLGFSRLRNAAKTIRKSEIFEFRLSPDKEENVEVLLAFLRGKKISV